MDNITKEQFLEMFKKECENCAFEGKVEAFKILETQLGESSVEISVSNLISLHAFKTKEFKEKPYSYTGQILFRGFVDYKTIPILEEDFNSLVETCSKSESLATMKLRNKIILEGEESLKQLLHYNTLKH